MKTVRRVGSVIHHFAPAALFLMLGVVSIQVNAETVDITAKFSPNPADPHINKFVNTTPNSGFCAAYPSYCKDYFSIAIPGMSVKTSSPIAANHPDLRQGAMFKVPAEYRTLSVMSPSGSVKELKVRILGFGSTQRFTTNVTTITGVSGVVEAHSALWGGTWLYGAAPCKSSPLGSYNDRQYRFFWLTPVASPCGKRARFTIPEFTLDTFNFAYDLITPDPLDMEAGFYQGAITYTVGPGMDLDFGDALLPNDSALTLNFNLHVQHMLRVYFPPGADRLTLYPEGGWQQWLQYGRRPAKLSSQQTFQIWSSTRFKMQLRCQYDIGGQCGISNDAGHSVPVETRVTLPNGLLSQANQPVNRYSLSSTTPAIFHPTHYVDNSRAVLDFEVSKQSVEEMTAYAGTRYSGSVTVVWDTQI